MTSCRAAAALVGLALSLRDLPVAAAAAAAVAEAMHQSWQPDAVSVCQKSVRAGDSWQVPAADACVAVAECVSAPQ